MGALDNDVDEDLVLLHDTFGPTINSETIVGDTANQIAQRFIACRIPDPDPLEEPTGEEAEKAKRAQLEVELEQGW